MVNPLHTLSFQTGLRTAQSLSEKKKAFNVTPEEDPCTDEFTVVANESLQQKMDKFMVPKYISKTNRPKIPRTSRTTRFHALELELFSAQPRAGKNPGDAPSSKHIDLVGSGVYRTAKVPENYSIQHLDALVCQLMGWPLETALDVWVRDGKSTGGNNNIEVWFCLIPNREVENKWTVLPRGNTRGSPKSTIKLSEVWNPYGLMSSRLKVFSQRPVQVPGSLSVRIKCEGASLHSKSFSIDEPFAIGGYGAPPASHLPRVRERGQLKERLETKKFEGWAFYGYWDFVEGRTVSEVDVEGVHLWEIDSLDFIRRLEILERRVAGNWMADLEEHAVEFESDFMVIPKCVDAF